MNLLSYRTRPFLAAIGGTAATLLTPNHCWAAEQASLPWDYTFNAVQNFVTGPLVHSIIIICGIAAMLAFALAGDNELARRFVKAVIGTAIALVAAQVLNYLAP